MIISDKLGTEKVFFQWQKSHRHVFQTWFQMFQLDSFYYNSIFKIFYQKKWHDNQHTNLQKKGDQILSNIFSPSKLSIKTIDVCTNIYLTAMYLAWSRI